MSSTASTATNLRLSGISLPVVRGVFVIRTLTDMAFLSLEIPRITMNLSKIAAPTDSFGVMTYQILTDKKPFERNNTWAMIKLHVEEPPPDPSELVPIPASAASAIMKAMAKKPDERFASVGEFVEALGK